MKGDIPILLALGAGLISFISPCVLPLVPMYISFVTGLTSEELSKAQKSRKHLVRSVLPGMLMFVMGFSFIFILLGASASAIGSFLLSRMEQIKIVGGMIVILFGIHITGLIRLKFLEREKRAYIRKKPPTIFGAFFVGMVFAFAWTPCIGPILASVLTLAGAQKSVGRGILLLAVYSLGLAIPFVLAGIGISWLMGFFGKLKRHYRIIQIVSGVLLIIIGFIIIFGDIQSLMPSLP